MFETTTTAYQQLTLRYVNLRQDIGGNSPSLAVVRAMRPKNSPDNSQRWTL